METPISDDRPDVFISYAREDADFVRRLAARLDAEGKRAWIDWKDIRPTADWRAKVRAGIDAAAAFVFVLTPDSLDSEVCEEELVHALEGNKRLVPLLRAEVDGLSVPAALQAPNWIHFRDTDDFDAAVRTLVEALETDLGWIDDHARLLVRAREWRAERSDASFLLRGSDLAAAERWLAQEAEHSERATELHREYIAASRAAARRRRLTALGAAAAAVVVAAALAVALLQQSERATTASRDVRSKALAARAMDTLRTDPVRALRAAIDARATAPTPEAAAALRRTLDAPRPAAVLRVPDDDLRTARFGADAGEVITSDFGGTLRSWDLAEGRSREAGRDPTADWPASRDVSPDGGLRVIAARGGTVRLEDAVTGARLLEIANLGLGMEGAPPSAAFSPDGREFLTAGYDGTVKVWRVPVRRLPARGVVSAAFTADGRRCLTIDARGMASLWSAGGRLLRSWRYAGGPVAPGVRAPAFIDGDRLVAIASSLETTVWDPASRERLARFDGELSFSRSGDLVLEPGQDRTASIVELRTGAVRSRLGGLRHGAGRGAFSADDRRVATSSRQEKVVRVWDARSGRSLGRLGPFSDPVDDLDISPDGRLVATAAGLSAQLWDVESRRARRLPGPEGFVLGVRFSPDGTMLAGASADRTARVWDVRTGRVVTARTADPETVLLASLSRDERLLTVGIEGSALIWECESCRPEARLLEAARAALAGVREISAGS